MRMVVRPLAALRDGALDPVLGGRIDGGGRIVQDQDARIGEEGARQGQPLALSAGERDAALADDGLVPLVEGLDELMRLRGLGGRRAPRSRVAPGLPKAMLSLMERENRKISCSIIEICAAQRGQVPVADIHAVHQHLSLSRRRRCG